MIDTRTLLSFLFILVLSWSSLSAQNWYKGNLHAHSLWSDGNDYPEMIMQWYHDQGYDFAVLSDHNILAEGDRWMTLEAADSIAQQLFQRYQDQFGAEWVETRQQAGNTEVRLKTLSEYRSQFEEEGKFLILKAEEITDQYDGRPIHLNATNLQSLISPQGGNSMVEVMQNDIDAVHAQREATGQAMMVHLNHPNFGWAITAEEMAQLEGERFFEVYNGHPSVNNEGDKDHLSTEQIWDYVNTAYCLANKPLLLGLATDDSHHYHQESTSLSNAGRGWVMVRAESLQAESLIQALEEGDFYASSGVSLKKIQYLPKQLKLKVAAEPGVRYIIEFVGTKQDAPDQAGRVLQRVEGKKATYRYQGDELYVRARILSDQLKSNPNQAGEVEKAWMQPVKVVLP